MRTHFGTFRTALAITKQTAERFRLQTANSTRQIQPVIFPISAFAPSAPREIGEFSSTFSAAIAPIRRAQPPLDLTHVFLGGHDSSATAAYTAVCLFRFSVLLFRSSWCARSHAPRRAARQRREGLAPKKPNGRYGFVRNAPHHGW